MIARQTAARRSGPAQSTESGGPPRGRVRISPGERWLLISEKAYSRAQRRGFLGGDPYQDWLAAEREVDARFAVDGRAAFNQGDAEALIDLLRCAYGGLGLGYLDLDSLLRRHREGLARLAARRPEPVIVGDGPPERRRGRVPRAVHAGWRKARSLRRGAPTLASLARRAGLSTRALEELLAHVRRLLESTSSYGPKPG